MPSNPIGQNRTLAYWLCAVLADLLVTSCAGRPAPEGHCMLQGTCKGNPQVCARSAAAGCRQPVAKPEQD